MTEAEWLACTDPQAMLWFLRGQASDRKLRLLSVAFCRHIWHLMLDERSRTAVEVAERYADNRADLTELSIAQEAAYFVFHRATERHGVQLFAHSAAASASAPVAGAAGWWVEEPENTREAAWAAALVTGRQTANVARFLQNIDGACSQTTCVHCILGTLPFRPVRIEPTWTTSTVKQLAESIYEERAFDRLPFLADALEEAGCPNQEVLQHCRNQSEHVRGCWVVDLVLERK